MARGYRYYLLAELINALLLGVFVLFSLFVLQNNLGVFQNYFLNPFFAITWRAFLISATLTLSTVPASLISFNKILLWQDRNELIGQPIISVWQWLMFYGLLRTAAIICTWIFLVSFTVWSSVLGQDTGNLFFVEFLSRVFVPHLIISVFGLGAAAIVGATLNYRDRRSA